MKVENLQKYFEDAGSNKISFEGKCHDCKAPVCVNVDLEEDGRVVIEGGALFNPQIGLNENNRQIFLKCDSCFNKNSVLQNYKPCSVYSRVVGYLRPVSDWNDAKKAEFEDRKCVK